MKKATIFFFHATAITPIYTLSLHDALPILEDPHLLKPGRCGAPGHLRNSRLSHAGLVMRASPAPRETIWNFEDAPVPHICLVLADVGLLRSEERRVGKECRSG